MRDKRVSVLSLLFLLIFLFMACSGNPEQVLEDVTAGTVDQSGAPSGTTQSVPDSENTARETATQTEDIGGTAVSRETRPGTEPTTVRQNSSTKPSVTVAAPTTTATPKAGAVSLSVDCKTAIDYGIREQPGYAKILPEDGLILPAGNYSFTEGETALDVLKRTLQANNIILNERRGGYVVGIGGLNERACGPSSGWLYRVNGEQPLFSSSQYKLKTGDKVEFVYTCTLGDL